MLSLVCFIQCLVVASYGQSSYYFRHYEVAEGLANNNVTCSAIDRNGFMWFGTRDGLNRFDGYTFKTFRYDPNDSTSLGSNSVITLLVAPDGKLLVGTQKGLYIYDAVKNSFSVVPSTKDRFVNSLCADKKGNIWMSSERRLFQFNRTTGKSRWFPLHVISPQSVCLDDEDRLWVSSKGFLYRYDSTADSFEGFDLRPTAKTGSVNVLRVFNAGNGALLIGTYNQGILSFDVQSRKSTIVLGGYPGMKQIVAKEFLKYTDDEVWAATEAGLFIFNTTNRKVTTLRMEPNNEYSLSDNAINTLCRDNEGGIWAGTRFGGLCYYPYPYNHFEKYFPRPGINSIQGNGVHEICPDENGNLWIGTEDAGLHKLDIKTQESIHISPGSGQADITHSNIHGLLIHGQELWIGTYQNGLVRMNLKTRKVNHHYIAGKNSFNSNFVVNLFRTRSGRILVGTWTGLFEYERSSNTFKPVPDFQFQTQSMMEDRQGILWITTLGKGVFAVNEKTGQVKHFPGDPSNQNSLPNSMVNGQFEDSRGLIWFATEGGLTKLDPVTGCFKTFTTNDGLPSNFLLKVLEDKSKNLWISSTKGLIRFNTVNETFKVFTEADGLLNDQFNWNSAYKDCTGRLYFGSVKGMISFLPENFTINNKKPPVYITGFQVFNRDLGISENATITTSINFAEKVKLKHDQSTISIDFAALSFTSPETNEYAYKMEGRDKEWTYLKSNRKAYFTQMPPGVYIFKVKASNNSGLWNEKETTLEIEILPPVWATKWAYSFYILVALGCIAAMVRNYHKRMSENHQRKITQIEHEKESELYKNKIEFFTNIAHEIRTPLTLIQGPLENIMNCVDKVPDIKRNLKIMERNTNRLLDIANQLLDFRQAETTNFALKLEYINVSGILEDLHESFQPLATQHNLKFVLHLNVKNVYAFADADSLQKILGNLYSNAIKYAEKQVEVSFEPLPPGNKIIIKIKNDGFLIPCDLREKIFEPFFRITETSIHKGTGIGLAISRSLAELHQAKLTLEEPENGMNVFMLELLIRQENQHL